MAALNFNLDVLETPPEKLNAVSILDAKLAVILRDYVQHSNSLLEPVGDSILSLLPAASSYRDGFPLACLVTEIAEQIPYHHPAQAKLVTLLCYLAQSPTFLTETKSPGGYPLYHCHQALGQVTADKFTAPASFEPPVQFVNYNAFLARVQSASIGSGNPTYAIWIMRDAFERAPTQEWEREYYVMAAAQWILWSGQCLFMDVLYLDKTSSKKSWQFGSLYTGGGGGSSFLSLDRWHFWKKGFASVQNSKYGDECKNLASKAVELMGAIDGTMTF